MKTNFDQDFLATDDGAAADRILRSCVHCGFCNATCPTYQVEGNELDGPRGRIYLIKSMLEGAPAGEVTRQHLDRCLTCRACETTCPSGVEYHHLLDIGRREVLKRAPRSLIQRGIRRLLVEVMSRRNVFSPLVSVGRYFKWLTPSMFKHYLPARRAAITGPTVSGGRHVILAEGCVQPGLSPTTNEAVRSVLARFDIDVVSAKSELCCGAMAFHMDAQERALQQARANVDAWYPLLEAGAEGVLISATGCSNFVKDYAHLLQDDADYAHRARRVTDALCDISQVLLKEDIEQFKLESPPSIVWHCPCTAQHGQNLDGSTKEVLKRFGFDLPPVKDSHLCCGSAGTYSLFHPARAKTLRQRKLDALETSNPDSIVTANIGCQLHLSGGTQRPVVHWIELVARELAA